MKLRCKDKQGGDGICNVLLLTMLNTDLKILAKILADRLQTPLIRVGLFGRTLQDSLHLVDGGAVLIGIDQSKAFEWIGFLEVVLRPDSIVNWSLS